MAWSVEFAVEFAERDMGQKGVNLGFGGKRAGAKGEGGWRFGVRVARLCESCFAENDTTRRGVRL